MKHLSLNKYLKLALTLSTMAAFIALIIGGLATHRQESFNEALFWETGTSTARTLNAIGVFSVIIGWGLFQFFADAKVPRAWAAYLGMFFTLLGTLLINGILGLVAGSLALVLIITIFVLIVEKTKTPLWTAREFKLIKGSKAKKGGSK